MLLDGLASIGASDERFDDLEEAGGRIATFRTPKLGSWTRLHRRNHRRAIVIDGRSDLPAAWPSRTSGLAMRRIPTTGAT